MNRYEACQSVISPEVVVNVGLFDPLVFGPSILEPDLDLGLAETERGGQLGAPGAGHVLGCLEFQFQTEGLLLRESGPLSTLAQTLPLSPRHYTHTKKKSNECGGS